jgi:hypothetical protein
MMGKSSVSPFERIMKRGTRTARLLGVGLRFISPVWLVIAAGCGSSIDLATVEGTAAIHGKPLSKGSIVLHCAGRAYAGAIGPGGQFTVMSQGKPLIPPGTYVVTLLPPPPVTQADLQTTELRTVSQADPRDYPDKFRSPDTSGMTKEIQAGKNQLTLDFDAPK